MAWLLVGGAGYIGSHVVDLLSKSGEQVFVFDNFQSGNLNLIKDKCDYMEGDISSDRDLTKLFRTKSFEGVINLAALKSIQESVNNPISYSNINHLRVKSLIDFCIEFKVEYFLQSSTAAVYGIPDSGIASESTPTIPISHYGNTKLAAEQVLADAINAGKLRGISLRYFNVVGAKSGEYIDKSGSNLFPILTRAIEGRRPLQVYGNNHPTPDGTCIRDYIHVLDLAHAHLLTINALRQRELPLNLNLGSGVGHSVLEVISEMLKFHNLDLPIDFLPKREGDGAKLIANVDLMVKELGFKPLRELHEMVESINVR
jgi:UDP-glucose 4-epimerase